MSYAMERDSRRGRDEWRSCHTFKNITCDGDVSSTQTPRSGALKMGHNYYYYYELDGTTETHDPAMPSTTTCPYLPGQRVNTLWVPDEKTSRQRSASVSAARVSDFQTTNPADRFANPRPPASSLGAPSPILKPSDSTAQPLPRLRLRQMASSCSLSSATSKSAWPRRLFVRRRTPIEHELEQDDDDDSSSGSYDAPRGRRPGDAGPSSLQQSTVARLLVASASSLSLSVLQTHHRHDAAPSVCSRSSAASEFQGGSGSRSRDMSPNSLRRFLIEGGPQDDEEAKIDTIDDDDVDEDEHNFAVSAASETAPLTVLSPPPPPRSATPSSLYTDREAASSRGPSPLPYTPTQVPPPIPPVVTTTAPPATADTSNKDKEGGSLLLDVPPLSPVSFRSPDSLGPMSSPSVSPSETDEDDEFFDCGDFLPPPQHPFRQTGGVVVNSHNRLRNTAHRSNSMNTNRKASQDHEDLVAAFGDATFPHANSTTALVPSGRLDELVDELGWMATAIQS